MLSIFFPISISSRHLLFNNIFEHFPYMCSSKETTTYIKKTLDMIPRPWAYTLLASWR
ncbi:uncharacterized protein MELLADRAFT_89089 [Melampsora larici-populina 98AG31]|uniref:Uncharacterized protein n=1 Tax=Melampsora larici-populina (strain 98AG31 / pathotype 3-4-7) TaxID=747676 RepID=F4R6Z4_MELLP|nr:uncharacterized protein MELLADRAFT_89089 [Melampsora larici-populina 98AG31]EGG12368.1 hypothetical protein MELLADRAFT_89089 [Melampsora larici-populina 98AG31]